MQPHPSFIPGSHDHRSYFVKGHGFYVSRTAQGGTFGFHGGGRDGDVVADDAPQFEILSTLLKDVTGVRNTYGPDFEAESVVAMDAVEDRLSAAAHPRMRNHTRTVSGEHAVAAAILDAAQPADTTRRISLRNGETLNVVVPPVGDATVSAWNSGSPPLPFVKDTLALLGVEARTVGGAPNELQYALPRAQLKAFLDAALKHYGPGDVRCVDEWR